ncbi:MAG: asparagine synthase C-terminal domain-containing protein, partial [Gemmatimonadota bacterium]
DLERMLYTDLMTRMPDHLLPIVDRMAMAHGLEVRPPMLEHRMVEFAATVPSNLKLKGGRLKHILRQVAARHLPRELVFRPKQGFGFPIAHWLRKELAPLLRNLARSSRFVEAGIFEREYVARLVDEHLSGHRDHNFRLWILINLEIWYRIFLESAPVEAVEEWLAGGLTDAYATTH